MHGDGREVEDIFKQHLQAQLSEMQTTLTMKMSLESIWRDWGESSKREGIEESLTKVRDA